MQVTDSAATSTEEVRFSSGDGVCAATFRRPDTVAAPPLLVMGHGLGGTRKMGLAPYAERFAAAGIATLTFTYRHFGDSDGRPRQLLSVGRQLEDWASALRHAREALEVDTGRIALWGTSFGGGHALMTAARDGRVKAVVVQCPFTDGLASVAAIGPRGVARLVWPTVRDAVSWATRAGSPITVPIAGPPGSTALMSAPDALGGMLSLVSDDEPFVNAAAARIVLRVPLYRPGRAARRIEAPVLFCVADGDSVAPAPATLRHARRGRSAAIIRYPVGHFELYTGQTFERVVADQVEFLQRHLL